MKARLQGGDGFARGKITQVSASIGLAQNQRPRSPRDCLLVGQIVKSQVDFAARKTTLAYTQWTPPFGDAA
jgi:hypothetical protein